MIKSLLKIRFLSIFAGLTAQNAKRKKPMSAGMIFLYIFLFLYLIAAGCGMMVMTFASLAPAYHTLDLDWLYFSVAGLMALGFSIIGSVFATQSQLYDAKDNNLLLAMPIPPGKILLSRMIPLLALNLLFAGIVLVPAMAMYAILIHFSLTGILLQFLCLLGICLLAQAIACVLGWLLHLLLRKISASVASVVYMVVFLGLYFFLVSKAQGILQTMADSGAQLASLLKAWVWPLYAMGNAGIGSGLYGLIFFGICAAVFAVAYSFLSKTFLRTATASSHSRKAKKLENPGQDRRSPIRALCQKELRKFLSSPVYLTNMGIGLLMTAAVPVAIVFLRPTLIPMLQLVDSDLVPLMICAMLTFTLSTCCISTPSVSLEGKNLWILKSLPISGLQILQGKLRFHLVMTVPLATCSGLVTAAILGCHLPHILLCGLIPALFAGFDGLLGMWAGLHWVKFDYISESYPVKQSVAVLVCMFVPMGLVALLGVVCWLLWTLIPIGILMLLCALLLAAGCFGLYRVMITWGIRKWNTL